MQMRMIDAVNRRYGVYADWMIFGPTLFKQAIGAISRGNKKHPGGRTSFAAS